MYDRLQATLAEVEVHSGGGCTADNTTHWNRKNTQSVDRSMDSRKVQSHTRRRISISGRGVSGKVRRGYSGSDGGVIPIVGCLCYQTKFGNDKGSQLSELPRRRVCMWHINIIDRGYGKMDLFAHQPIQNAGSYAKVMCCNLCSG